MSKGTKPKGHRSYCSGIRSSARGFSLVEVLVAILLFSLGTLTVLTMTVASMQANDASRSVDAATNLARSLMDRLLSLDYDHADLVDRTADGFSGLLTETVAGADSTSAAGRYQQYWNVAGSLPVNNTKTLCVIVVWSQGQASKRVVFQSIKAK